MSWSPFLLALGQSTMVWTVSSFFVAFYLATTAHLMSLVFLTMGYKTGFCMCIVFIGIEKEKKTEKIENIGMMPTTLFCSAEVRGEKLISSSGLYYVLWQFERQNCYDNADNSIPVSYPGFGL